MPTVSLLIPARNAAATLDQALGSVKAQTFFDWEAIVVDDGSRDDTPVLLRAWARRDERFRLVRNPDCRGLVVSLNRALERARGSVIARMDADDISLPRRLELQMKRLREGDVAAVGCRVRYFPEDEVAGGALRYQEWLNSVITPEEHDRDIFVECPLSHPTIVADAAAMREVGGYEAHGWAEDYDLVLRLWRSGYRIAKVPETLFLWREGAERTSRIHSDYTIEAFMRCKAHYLRLSCFAAGLPALVFGAGPVGKAVARALTEVGVTLAGFVDLDPRKIGQEVYGVKVLNHDQALARKGEVFGVVALGQPGARQDARRLLSEGGWVECRDFRCVA
jgi:glycosyltransferase involved in cell wall biosynthesis